jgi:hypothetical protein
MKCKDEMCMNCHLDINVCNYCADINTFLLNDTDKKCYLKPRASKQPHQTRYGCESSYFGS